MPVARRIHWQVPTIMVSSLLAGVGLAVGHHVFYNSLVGTPVGDGTRDIAGYGISQQQVNIAVGTIFAFLIKVCLVLSITIAYTQAFWRAIGKRATKIHNIDVMDSALENIWVFLKVHIWWKYPLLLCLALSVWFVPIASTITPSTISVVIAAPQPLPTSTMHVPQADFKSLKMISPGNFIGMVRDLNSSTEQMFYDGPSRMTQRITKTTASLGSILAIPAPGVNASYEMSFQGPYLKCGNMNSTFQYEVQKSIIMNYANKSNCADYYNFLSWTSSRGRLDSNYSVIQPMPFDSYKPYDMNIGSLGPMLRDPLTENNDTATLYFAVMPQMHHEGTAKCPARESAQGFNDAFSMFNGSTFLQCELWNTTYHAKFNFTGGEQKVALDFPKLNESTPVPSLYTAYINTGWHTNNRPNDYTFDGCNTVGEGRYNYVDCKMNPKTLEKLSFQSVMDSFGSLLVGGVRQGDGYKVATMVSSTSVLTTSLMSSKDLGFLSGASSWRNNTMYLPFRATDQFGAILPDDIHITDMSLGQSLEQLFQNITVSMMSAEMFHPNVSSPFAPPPVNVTFHTFQNVYAYSEMTLWLSYGIAILVCTIAVAVGLGCILIAGASWADDFSTIMRTTRDADLSAHLAGDDRDGRHPLPNHLKQATIRLTGEAFMHNRGRVEYTNDKDSAVVQKQVHKQWKNVILDIRRTDA